jgi:putative transposase
MTSPAPSSTCLLVAIAKQPLFLDEADYLLYLALLGGIAIAKKWRVLAYCLMPNHVHLLIETPEGMMARGMQHLHGLYARMFNDKYAYVGHHFQGRYGSTVIRDDAQLLTVVRYIALNPAAAGLVREPLDWPWNSCVPATTDAAPSWLDVDRLLEYLGEWSADAMQLYREIVSGGLRVSA